MDAVALRDQIAAAASRAAADFDRPCSDIDPVAAACAARSQLARFALSMGLAPSEHVFKVTGTLAEGGRVDIDARISETLRERLAAAGLTPGQLV